MIGSLTPVSRLTDLSIYYLEPLLDAHPPLSQAIAKLTSIEKICFFRVGKRSMEMVHSMQSRLATVYLDPVGSFRELFSKTAHGNAVMLLRQFAGSLRDVHLAALGATTAPGPEGDRDAAPRYPLLSALTLNGIPSPTTWHYVRAFPNLKTLSIAADVTERSEAEDVGFAEFRRRNGVQLRERGCWDALDAFEGSIVMLWLLGLPCPVRDLAICVDEEVEHTDADVVLADMLREALRPARPTRLDLTFAYHFTLLDGGVRAALVEGCGGTVRELGLLLQICSGACTGHGDLSSVLVSVGVGPRSGIS